MYVLGKRINVFGVNGVFQVSVTRTRCTLRQSWGESVVFNCHVEFPGEHPVPYVLQWEKKVGDSVRYRTTSSALYIRELNTWAPLEDESRPGISDRSHDRPRFYSIR